MENKFKYTIRRLNGINRLCKPETQAEIPWFFT